MLSALNQPEVSKVIVIDDCSTDETVSRAERIGREQQPRVAIVRLPSNRGPATARNVGLDQSVAPWAAILDSDDFFLPGRVNRLLSLANNQDFVADDCIQIQEGQTEDLQSNLLGKNFEPWQLNFEEFVLANVSVWGQSRKELGFLKPMMRRSFLSRNQLRYDNSLRLGEDYALYARALALRARFLLIPVGGYVSVERTNSISSRHTMRNLERLRDTDHELGGIDGLTISERLAIRRHYHSVDARAQWLAVIDAFKARSLFRFIAPFLRSWTVSSFLVWNLVQQAQLRGCRLIAIFGRAASRALRRLLLRSR